MSSDAILTRARTAILNGDEEAAIEVARDALASGVDPVELISGALSPAMAQVGRLFADEEYGLPEVVCAADAMKQAMAILEPVIRESNVDVPRLATVVIGTAPGDIHDIGKHIVATMLAVNGFEVFDLGKDVPIETFVRTTQESGASLVGCSAMMTTTMGGQQALVEALQAAGRRDSVRVMVGGSTTSQAWADKVGADGWAENANDAVVVAKELASAAAEVSA